MNFPGHRLAVLLAVALIPSAALCAQNADTPDKITAGATFESLIVGEMTYQQVRVRTLSAQTAIIQHEGGIASLRLRDLPPDLQRRFGYDPGAAASEAEKQKAAELLAQQRRLEEASSLKRRPPPPARVPTSSISDPSIATLSSKFGEAPQIQAKVDLRPRFNELGLWIKQQGVRPSCSVFAIVSALEFQTASLTGTATRFSEEYLLWATRKSLNRLPVAQPAKPVSGEDSTEQPVTADEGFSLPDVVAALRTYGVPPRELMPNRFTDNSAGDPPADVVAQASKTSRAAVHLLPGDDAAAQIPNLIHALNAGIPVPAGMAWPREYNWRTGHLDKNPTEGGGGHAITFVGYKSATGRIEDAVFTFKNSWGVRWGVDGYGTATYDYLSKNLWLAVVLEVLPQ